MSATKAFRVQIHIATKNVQSMRAETRFQDCLAELDAGEHDLVFLSETWRSELHEVFETPRQGKLYLSGGFAFHGVGIYIAPKFCKSISGICFHAISARLCMLQFSFHSRRFHAYSCYFPTSWDNDDSVDELYSVLDLMLANSHASAAISVLGGDFNAHIGAAMPHDDVGLLGSWGSGVRNVRGSKLTNWVLEHQLHIVSRFANAPLQDSWTCKRAFDTSLVQIDYIICDVRLGPLSTWNDFSIATGLDHRCVHSLVEMVVTDPVRHRRRRKSLKGWHPILDAEKKPSHYHAVLQSLLAQHLVPSLETIEKMPHAAGERAGHCSRHRPKFSPSLELQQLRRQRRTAISVQVRKSLSLEICRLHRQEVRSWKASNLSKLLNRAAKGASLRQMLCSYSGKKLPLQPQPDEFADDLEALFAGNPPEPCRPSDLDETPWTMGELQCAIHRLKVGRAADDVGLVIELLKHAPDEVLSVILNSFNTFLLRGNVPAGWRKTVFTMLAKMTKARTTLDFRPIANVRLMYKVFARMILGRIENILDASQPEEQHGFRVGRRIEEHLLTANVLLDKTFAANLPLWIVSVDFAKAFDSVEWSALWTALRTQGVSDHLVWVLQMLYQDQEGVVRGDSNLSRWFKICGGVRQGCVLSPRLFCAVLQAALSAWRQSVEFLGLDFGDGLPPLLDLRFADDLLLFANSANDAAQMLDELVRCCSAVGLRLNARKTKVLTTEAQAPPKLITPLATLSAFCRPVTLTNGWAVYCRAVAQKQHLLMWTFICRLRRKHSLQTRTCCVIATFP